MLQAQVRSGLKLVITGKRRNNERKLAAFLNLSCDGRSHGHRRLSSDKAMVDCKSKFKVSYQFHQKCLYFEYSDIFRQ